MSSTGVMPIPCPHFKITIVKRSQGQSAVAGAAYQSGERLFSEYDQKMKFYNKKKEFVHAEIKPNFQFCRQLRLSKIV